MCHPTLDDDDVTMTTTTEAINRSVTPNLTHANLTTLNSLVLIEPLRSVSGERLI